MSIKEFIEEKIEEVDAANEVMHPVEDLHLWEDLKRLSSEIMKAADSMLPIKDLHFGKDLIRMAKEIDNAQDIMYRLPESKTDRIHSLLHAYADLEEAPVLLTGLNYEVLYANKAAIAQYGEEILGSSAEELGLEKAELKEASGRILGYCLK